MRTLRRIALSLLLAGSYSIASFALGPVSTLAQDEFDDEFDDEFEDDTPTVSEQAPASDVDGEGDEFSEEDLADAADEAGVEFSEDTDEDDTSDEAHDEAHDEEVDEERMARLFRTHNTWRGSVGGIQVTDAGSGEPGSFRLQLATEFFSSSDFLIADSSHGHLGSSLSLSWTVHEMVEVFASLLSAANSNDQAQPNLLMVLGDMEIGTKVFYRAMPMLTVGGELRARLVNPVADVGVSFGNMAIGIGANVSMDLRELDEPLPILARFNLGYTFDNSAGLIEDIEDARYGNLDMPDPIRENESRHLVTRHERFSLGINRTDTLNIGLGGEFPVEVSEDWWLHPIVEWTWGIPVNRQGYNCLFLPDADDPDVPREGEDGCLDRAGISAFPMDIILGLRILPPVEGLSFLASANIGLTGTSIEDAVREVSANAPWSLMLSVSYAYKDQDPPEPEIIEREIVREVEVEAEPEPMGRIVGQVVVENEDTPIQGARIAFPGRELTDLVTDENGRFTTYAMSPDEVLLQITHPEYHPGGCIVTLPAEGGDISTRCELAIPLVVVEETEVEILQQINFAHDSAEILSSSFTLMQQIADVLRLNADLRRIEIQGHTDDRGTPSYNQDLSQRRAESVMEWLVNAGISPERLNARGFGLTRPLVDEQTPEARAQNRRVQFLIEVRD